MEWHGVSIVCINSNYHCRVHQHCLWLLQMLDRLCPCVSCCSASPYSHPSSGCNARFAGLLQTCDISTVGPVTSARPRQTWASCSTRYGCRMFRCSATLLWHTCKWSFGKCLHSHIHSSGDSTHRLAGKAGFRALLAAVDADLSTESHIIQISWLMHVTCRSR